jgi:2-hydroxy-3-oxopropionate reductase
VAQLGFVGRGIMGKPMAGHLIAAGHAVRRYGRSGAALELTGGHAVAKRAVAA